MSITAIRLLKLNADEASESIFNAPVMSNPYLKNEIYRSWNGIDEQKDHGLSN